MTDVAYMCHNCGCVHELESIRENLILDLRTAASYELAGQRGMLDPRARFLRWRMTRGLAQALWPRYSHHPRLVLGRRRAEGRQPAPEYQRRYLHPAPLPKTMIGQSERPVRAAAPRAGHAPGRLDSGQP
jgi:hypothetical protein